MKLIQRDIFDYFGKATFEIKNDKLIETYKNLKYESSWVHKLSKIVSYRSHKNSSSFWDALFTPTLIIIVIYDIITRTLSSFYSIFIHIILIILLIVFLLLQFWKDEYVGFYDEDDNNIFSIKLIKSDTKTLEFLKILQDKIKKNPVRN